MFTWLMGLPIWFQISFSICIFICIVFTFILGIKKGVSIKTKYNNFLIGDSSKEKEESSIIIENPHKNCTYNKDVIILLNESSKLIQEKHFLKYTQQIRDQMNFAEQKVEQIRAILQKVYLEALKRKNIEDLASSVSFNAYRAVLIEIQNEMLSCVRQCIRENHLDSFSEISYGGYVKDKSAFMKAEFSDLLNRYYFYKQDISREELYNLFQPIEEETTKIFVEILQMARIISIINNVKLNEIDEKLKMLIDDFMGW